MLRKKTKNILVGLDVGTTKICAVVAERDEKDVRILGIGYAPSQGLRKGMVINVEKTVEAIRKSIAMAEEKTDVDIYTVFAGIAGGHIQSITSRGVVPISGSHGEITEDDIKKVVNAAKAISLPMEREIIHTIPQEFIVDGQGGILDPRGMSGIRLEALVNVITAAISSAQNIIKSINKADVEVVGIVLQPIASSIATLTKEERESGVVLIDIGGGTTDFALFVEGSLRHSGVLAIGGDHVTNDIKMRFNIPTNRAEEAKIKFGCALMNIVDENEEFILPGTFGYPARSMLRKELSFVIESRMREILEIVKSEIEKTGKAHQIGAGLVMTGGASLMQGALEMAQEIFHVPVRLGIPQNVAGLLEEYKSPIYSTGIGLVMYGTDNLEQDGFYDMDDNNVFEKVVGSVKEMIKKYF
ncbi:cell division protein FtsA [bacterium]|nr:cell division protein FtsA [bacterium]